MKNCSHGPPGSTGIAAAMMMAKNDTGAHMMANTLKTCSAAAHEHGLAGIVAIGPASADTLANLQ